MQKPSTEAGLRAKRRPPLGASDAKDFLAKYKKAWENHDADLAASPFTRDARYWEKPFAEPIVSREAIQNYWTEATRRQEDIHFAVTNFLHSGYILVAEWTCTYRDRSSGERRELAGMFLADFYGTQVRAFREYGVSRTLPQVKEAEGPSARVRHDTTASASSA